ncbi:MAG: cyclic nucleotide-binding domain-containing protein [Acidobacteria bacterium]|nr:cyclic nucleotide-binding domain-containing protein [Acidobacteriota bacterium]
MSPPRLAPQEKKKSDSRYYLDNRSRVAVIGGGPAGSFFSYFFLEMAERAGLEAHADIYEAKDFSRPGPAGCNMCGGIVSESLVQLLATEGINLPPGVVQRGIDSYALHMDVGSVRIDPPGHEKRIAAVHRGAGPRSLLAKRWDSFDGHLLELAVKKGAKVIRERVDGVAWANSKPRLLTKGIPSEEYDLLVVASGVNAGALRLLESIGLGYTPPKITKTFICEFLLGTEAIETHLGSSMHVFLLNLPRLEFGAVIPKGEYVTLVLLGRDVDKELVESFLNAPEVKQCFPPDWRIPADYCRCFPSINIRGAPRPFADRVVFIGDSGENRLYKDGIGGSYRTAKAAAKTAVFEGVSAEAFRRHYFPVCRALAIDNAIGKVIFAVTRLIQGLRFTRRGILRMVAREQQAGRRPRMSGVLWDTFTGSAPYRDVFRRTLHPLFLGRFLYEIAAGLFSAGPDGGYKEGKVSSGELGKKYQEGEIVVRQGEVGDCMYVIQSGKVEVVLESEGKEICLAELGEGDFFGEMALFEKDVRSATVRPLGEARILTVDKKMFLRKIHEDPSLAYRIMQKMSRRIRKLNSELMRTVSASLEEKTRDVLPVKEEVRSATG